MSCSYTKQLYPSITYRELKLGPTAHVETDSFSGGALLLFVGFMLGLQSAFFGEELVRDQTLGLKDVLMLNGISLSMWRTRYISYATTGSNKYEKRIRQIELRTFYISLARMFN